MQHTPSHKQPIHHSHTQPTHPTLFSVSIFESAQEFMALYLAIENPSPTIQWAAAQYLQALLHRTKSPPIALTYTKEFLSTTNESQTQLAIIRFISQLSDLSVGKSMQTSLSFIIDHSSFLTELRHNLTHRVMVKGLVIERGREMILEELKEKFWRVMADKVWGMGLVEREKVEGFVGRIVGGRGREIEGERRQWIGESESVEEIMKQSRVHGEYARNLSDQRQRKLASSYLFGQCASNYEFKSLIKAYIMKKVLPQISSKLQKDEEDQTQSNNNIANLLSEQVFSQYFCLDSLPLTKQKPRLTILLSTLLQSLLSQQPSTTSTLPKFRLLLSILTTHLITLLKTLQKKDKQPSIVEQVFTSPIIMKRLRQVYLLQYIREFKGIVEVMPEGVKQGVRVFWERREEETGKGLMVAGEEEEGKEKENRECLLGD